MNIEYYKIEIEKSRIRRLKNERRQKELMAEIAEMNEIMRQFPLGHDKYIEAFRRCNDLVLDL